MPCILVVSCVFLCFKQVLFCLHVEMASKKRGEVWLVGKTIAVFPGTKLPSRGEVLRVLFHVHDSEPQLKVCTKEVAGLVAAVWDKAKIPSLTSYRIEDKVRNLHQE